MRLECEPQHNVLNANESACWRMAARARLQPQNRLFKRPLEQWVSLPPSTTFNKSSDGVRLTLYSMPGELSAWMAAINDSTPLVDLAIPSAHDAGSAATESWLSDWLRTQSFPLFLQMLLGVRAFDIRPLCDWQPRAPNRSHRIRMLSRKKAQLLLLQICTSLHKTTKLHHVPNLNCYTISSRICRCGRTTRNAKEKALNT